MAGTHMQKQQVTEDCLRPSIFGTYPEAFNFGTTTPIWLGCPASVSVQASAQDMSCQVVIEQGAASHGFYISSQAVSEVSLSRFLSYWMRDAFHKLPLVSPQAAYALVTSLAAEGHCCIWENALLSQREWKRVLNRARLETCERDVSLSIIKSLILEADLMAMLKSGRSVDHLFQGLQEALGASLGPGIADSIHRMATCIQGGKGVALLSDRSRGREAFEKVEDALEGYDWLVVCGDRMLERHAAHVASKRNMPVISMLSKNELRNNLLKYASDVQVVGRKEQLGVYRTQVVEASTRKQGGVSG
ncbi:hypothetical protein DU506_00775 [Vreelandella rituensis]|uniref:Uncharacterized protein n=2 Tax=Vreelandella rituensis TaxID=2282306 RepID=A0A368U9E0_9GAMM|nr:hypothetical protein DU506_00775 [Halomonas rituensis]